MKIAYVGNFTQAHCTEVHLAATLEILGHEVIRLQENEVLPETLSAMISTADWGLFLFTRTWGELVTLEHLAQLRERKIPSASYHLDLYIGLARKYLHQGKTLHDVLKTDPFWRTDFVFTPDGDPKSAEEFELFGVKHYYMKPAVYAPECKMAEVDGFKHDVLFVGGGDRLGSADGYGHPEWGYRDQLIDWLYKTFDPDNPENEEVNPAKYRFEKFGHPQQTIRNEALNALYATTKVVIGDSVCLDGFNHTYYWSDRVYETIGRGGFLIHPYIKGLEEEFKDGENIVFYEYGNFPQLKEKIDYYMANDDERERIRKAGFEMVKEKCTYTHRLKQMMETVFGTKDIYKEAVDEMEEARAQTPIFEEPKSPIKINLGAGSEPTQGWLNVDWLALEGIDVVQNLLETPWKLENNIADEIKAIDVLEHMPNYTPDNKSTPIAFIEECHRILRVGGKLTIQVPHWQSPNLWIDPTHVRGYDEKSMDYFDPEKDFGKSYGYYSDKKFRVSAELSHMENGSPSNVTFTMIKL